MSACSASFYAQGVKIRSGEATVTIDGTTLRVVAQQPAGDGEITVGELADGMQLRIAGISTPLLWKQSSQAREARHFDAETLQRQFGDEYPQVVEHAASNLSLTGAKESRGYAKAVANAWVGMQPVVGIASRIKERPGVLAAFKISALPEAIRHNQGAIGAVAVQLAEQTGPEDEARLIQLATLVGSGYGYGLNLAAERLHYLMLEKLDRILLRDDTHHQAELDAFRKQLERLRSLARGEQLTSRIDGMDHVMALIDAGASYGRAEVAQLGRDVAWSEDFRAQFGTDTSRQGSDFAQRMADRGDSELRVKHACSKSLFRTEWPQLELTEFGATPESVLHWCGVTDGGEVVKVTYIAPRWEDGRVMELSVERWTDVEEACAGSVRPMERVRELFRKEKDSAVGRGDEWAGFLLAQME